MVSFLVATMVPPPGSAEPLQQFFHAGLPPTGGLLVSQMVVFCSPTEGLSLSGAMTSHSDNGRQPVGMGWPPSISRGPGYMVAGGLLQWNQLAGTPHDTSLPPTVPISCDGISLLIWTDNVTAKAHVNRQEGTCSGPLMEEATQLLIWVEHHVLSLTAEHISGPSNIRADWLSRQRLDHTKC